jgi:phosphoglycerate dehydrogenase-like enzyme
MRYSFIAKYEGTTTLIEAEHCSTHDLADMFVNFMRACTFSEDAIAAALTSTDLVSAYLDQPEDH